MQNRTQKRISLTETINRILSASDPISVRDDANKVVGAVLHSRKASNLEKLLKIRQKEGEQLNFLEFCFKNYSGNRTALLNDLIEIFGPGFLQKKIESGVNLGETIAATGDQELLDAYLAHLENIENSHTVYLILSGHGDRFFRALTEAEDTYLQDRYIKLVAQVIHKKNYVNIFELYPASLGSANPVLEQIQQLKKEEAQGKKLVEAAKTERNNLFWRNTKDKDTLKNFEKSVSVIASAQKYCNYFEQPENIRAIQTAIARLLHKESPKAVCDIIKKHGLDINSFIYLDQIALKYNPAIVKELLSLGANRYKRLMWQDLAELKPVQIKNLMHVYDKFAEYRDPIDRNSDPAWLHNAKNAIYYYIKALPLDERIKRCEQALDKTTFLGSILYTQRGRNECTIEKGTLSWVNWLYQKALKEKAKEVEREERLHGKTRALIPGRHLIDLEERKDEEFETTAEIIREYKQLLKATNLLDNALVLTSIDEVVEHLGSEINDKKENVANLIVEGQDEKRINELFRILSKIAKSSKKHATSIANIATANDTNIFYIALQNTQKIPDTCLELLQTLAQTQESKTVVDILGKPINWVKAARPNTVMLGVARHNEGKYVSQLTNILHFIAAKNQEDAREVFAALRHSVSAAQDIGSQWNYGRTLARHQRAEQLLEYIKLLDCLEKQGISRAEVNSVAIQNYKRFDDKGKNKDTKSDIIIALQSLPINERIDLCDKALDPNHPLGRIMHMQRGKNACDINRGRLRQIVNMRAEAIKLQEQANAAIRLNNQNGRVNELWEMVRQQKRKDVKILCDLGANVNVADNNGITALHHACKNNDLFSARMLIEHGADINAVLIHKGTTPLMWAASRGYTEMVKLLLSFGADPKRATYANNNNALAFAVRANDLKSARMLLEHGSSAILPSIHTPQDLQEIARGMFKNNPQALKRAQELMQNADANNEIFITPGEYAEMMGYSEMAELINRYALIEHPELAKQKEEQSSQAYTHVSMPDDPILDDTASIRVEDLPSASYLNLKDRPSVLDTIPDFPPPSYTDALQDQFVLVKEKPDATNLAPPSYDDVMLEKECEASQDAALDRLEKFVSSNEGILKPDLDAPKPIAHKEESNEPNSDSSDILRTLFASSLNATADESHLKQLEEFEELIKPDLLLSFDPIPNPVVEQSENQEDLVLFESEEPQKDLISSEEENSTSPQTKKKEMTTEEHLDLLDQLKVPTTIVSNNGMFKAETNIEDEPKNAAKEQKKTAMYG